MFGLWQWKYFCVWMQATYVYVLRRRNWCNSKFYSLVKVRKQNPQKAILQNPKFVFLLNMRKYFTNGEFNLYWKFVQILSYNDSDANTAFYKCILLTSEISWLKRLFWAFMSWYGISEKFYDLTIWNQLLQYSVEPFSLLVLK